MLHLTKSMQYTQYILCVIHNTRKQLKSVMSTCGSLQRAFWILFWWDLYLIHTVYKAGFAFTPQWVFLRRRKFNFPPKIQFSRKCKFWLAHLYDRKFNSLNTNLLNCNTVLFTLCIPLVYHNDKNPKTSRSINVTSFHSLRHMLHWGNYFIQTWINW